MARDPSSGQVVGFLVLSPFKGSQDLHFLFTVYKLWLNKIIN